MNELTPDQEAMVEMVRDFAATELAPHTAQWDEDKHFPVDVLAQAGALGMGGIYVGEEHGGSGLSRTDAVLIFEELAAVDPTIAAYISIHNMVAWMIDAFGNDTQRQQWLPGITAMSELTSYCLSEPGVGSDAAAITTKAVLDGDDYLINGTKQFISGAGSSAWYLVMVRTADLGGRGITAVVVPHDAPGLSFGANEKKMGWRAQPTRQVVFDNVRIPVTNRLGEEGDGFGIAMKGLNGGRVNIGACSLGGGRAALEKSIAYLKERQAFGGPLIEKQHLLFEIAQMDTDLEVSRTMLMRAANALDTGAGDAVKLCAMAKLVATDAGFQVANQALQLHGGYGYLSEYGLEKLVRDLRVHQILEGSNEIMRLIVGRLAVER
ncbi:MULTISPECIES: acyl-CoA dehydrogenase family protein [Arthrobacter]|uniref:acyl-CoA dehydrogenase family protein n=1 Tax=unclassified Arthrobacter TaxID=235627 RepID=UPI0024BAEAB8|nr:acyl-CoA dehydrogenase family protein [Arthrobacter sp. H35-MC1]MDJ0317483.1 acyl-CoA dehydrogenase family protein [Arthrobacter sp. H35-MC1]